MDTNLSITLKFVNSGDSPKNFHFKPDFWLDLFFGVQLLFLLGPPFHLEQHGGGGEAIGTYGMAVRVLGAKIQLQPFGRVRINLSARASMASVSTAPARPVSRGLSLTPGPGLKPSAAVSPHTASGI